jgi:hypothetical protein
MESAAHDPQRLACTEEGQGPGEHLPRCPARERQQQEALGPNALLDEPGDAGSQVCVLPVPAPAMISNAVPAAPWRQRPGRRSAAQLLRLVRTHVRY